MLPGWVRELNCASSQKFNLIVNYYAFNIENLEVIIVDNNLWEISFWEKNQTKN